MPPIQNVAHMSARWSSRALAAATVWLVATECCAATIWIPRGAGDWFDPKNWTDGVPIASEDAIIANDGTAEARPDVRRRGIQARDLDIGLATSNLSGGGTLIAEDTDIVVQGSLSVGRSLAVGNIKGALQSSKSQGSPNGDVMVTGDMRVGSSELIESAGSQVTGQVSIDAGLRGLSGILLVGRGDGDGIGVGEVAVKEGVQGFRDIYVGWATQGAVGTASGVLDALGGLTGGRSPGVLVIGQNDGAGVATGVVSVTGDISGFNQVVIGRTTLNGEATGTLELTEGVLRTGLVAVGVATERGQAPASGVLNLINSAVMADSIALGPAGILTGNGEVTGRVSNTGIVRPEGANRFGQLRVQGDYTQLLTGVLQIDIGGIKPVSELDQLVVSGAATLDGALQVTFVDDFKPSLDDRLLFMDAAKTTGSFRSLAVQNPPVGLALQLNNTAAGWELRFANPRPDVFVPPSASSAAWSDSSIWGSGQVPNSTSQVALINNAGQAKLVRVDTNAQVHNLRVGGPDNDMSLVVGSEATLSATHEIIVQRGGVVSLDNGRMYASSLILQPGARFAGSGSFTGTLENRGFVGIGLTAEPAALTIEGDFIQDRRGTLDVDLGGTQDGQFDTILVDGTAHLGGFLDVSLLANLTLRPGDSFEILRARDGIVGTFDLMTNVFFDDVGLGLVYDMDSVILYASGFLLGDMDRDFDVDEEDIDDFVLGLKDAYAYHAAWGRPPSQSGNVNLDGDFGFDDIPPFLELLDAPAAQVPESTSLLLAWTGTLALVWVRRRLYPRR